MCWCLANEYAQKKSRPVQQNTQAAIKSQHKRITMNATHIKVYPSRRTHFQHCYNKYSKLCNTDVPQRVFPHGEKASSSLAITCLKNKLCFQICPHTPPPVKPEKRNSANTGRGAVVHLFPVLQSITGLASR